MKESVPRCSDFDEDCETVPDKLHCWLYDPAKGYCPYLRKETPCQLLTTTSPTASQSSSI
jgi:hypothetical protein